MIDSVTHLTLLLGSLFCSSKHKSQAHLSDTSVCTLHDAADFTEMCFAEHHQKSVGLVLAVEVVFITNCFTWEQCMIELTIIWLWLVLSVQSQIIYILMYFNHYQIDAFCGITINTGQDKRYVYKASPRYLARSSRRFLACFCLCSELIPSVEKKADNALKCFKNELH